MPERTRTSFPEAFTIVHSEVIPAVERVDPAEVDAFCDALLEADRVFVTGSGRSGLIGRMFAMRLMHLGLTAHVVGDATTPSIGKGDLLLAISGSGGTESVHTTIAGARKHGAAVAGVTRQADTRLAAEADTVLVLPGVRPPESRQLLHSIFDQTLLLSLDAVGIMLMERTGQTQDDLAARHTNL